MASNPLPARPATRSGAGTCYEIYVGAGEGFDLREVTDDRDAALALARRLAARPGALIRVMCETYDPARDETIERIVFDSATGEPGRRTGGAGEPFPHATTLPPVQPAVRPEPLPKLVVVFGGLSIAMALAAAGMAVF